MARAKAARVQVQPEGTSCYLNSTTMKCIMPLFRVCVSCSVFLAAAAKIGVDPLDLLADAATQAGSSNTGNIAGRHSLRYFPTTTAATTMHEILSNARMFSLKHVDLDTEALEHWFVLPGMPGDNLCGSLAVLSNDSFETPRVLHSIQVKVAGFDFTGTDSEDSESAAGQFHISFHLCSGRPATVIGDSFKQFLQEIQVEEDTGNTVRIIGTHYTPTLTCSPSDLPASVALEAQRPLVVPSSCIACPRRWVGTVVCFLLQHFTSKPLCVGVPVARYPPSRQALAQKRGQCDMLHDHTVILVYFAVAVILH